MNTIFLEPTLFIDTIIESQITKIKEKNKVNDNIKEKKIVVKTYKPEEPQDNQDEGEVIINEETDIESETPETNNQEPENEELILDSNEYEDIVFKDVFDNEYWGEN